MTHWIRVIRGPSGRTRIGYEVVNGEGRAVAAFLNKVNAGWRGALHAARREAQRLNEAEAPKN